VSSLAAAEAVLTRQQKESGTLLLDIGAGTTNLVIVEDGEVQYVSVLPVGGINVTNDLAIGLKTDLDIAETVKLKFATLAPLEENSISLEHENQTYTFDCQEIQMITEARIEEMLEMVDKELRKIGKARKLPGGVVLVGGTANLPGIAEFAREKLQLAARLGNLQSLQGLVDVVDNPTYATAIGLMQLDMLLTPETSGSGRGTPNQQAMGMIEGLLRKVRRKRS
jgi:cell division protein FtsA